MEPHAQRPDGYLATVGAPAMKRTSVTLSAWLYIGADNTDGAVDYGTLRTVLDKLHPDGYTVLAASGYWHGLSEPSAVAIVTGTRDAIITTARLLKSELRQDAIAVQWAPPMEFV